MKKITFLKIATICAAATTAAQAQTPRLAWGKPVEAARCEGANSDALDFAAVPNGKGIIFTSNRDADKQNRFDETEKMYCTDLWYADRLGFGKYAMPARLAGKVNSKSHEGVASIFPKNAERMVLSASSEEACDAAMGKARLKIKESTLAGDAWQKPIEMSFNLPTAGSCHPTLSADGQWLIFASDRPGSLGGMDLWATQQAADGSWSLPINLGEQVNSTGHELFPFLAPDGLLYFSSKRDGGAGGLDIFVAARDASTGQFGQPVALAAPFNSANDDFGFFQNADLRSGWFSSNRDDGANDDLWEWRAPARPTAVALAGLIREKGGPALAGQTVILKNKMTGAVLKTWTTDKTGEFALPELPCDADFEIVVNPDGPATERRDISTKNICDTEKPMLEKVIIELPTRPTTVPGLVGLVQEKGSGRLISDAVIILRNKKTGAVVQRLTSNARGEFRVPSLDCDTDYEIVVNPDGPNTERRDISTKNMCALGAKPAEVKAVVEVPAPTKDLVIRLDKLYYDYDKSNVRPDAAIELDKVVAFMRQYPSMTVELSSHTDSRGSDAYNLKLSERRAAEARQYILSKNIAPERITAVGRGETQLINHCKNGVKCTDPEHETNRRTEIRVLSFSEAGVKVQN